MVKTRVMFQHMNEEKKSIEIFFSRVTAQRRKAVQPTNKWREADMPEFMFILHNNYNQIMEFTINDITIYMFKHNCNCYWYGPTPF